MPTCVESQAPIPPPAYSRSQARSKDALRIDALALRRLAVTMIVENGR